MSGYMLVHMSVCLCELMTDRQSEHKRETVETLPSCEEQLSGSWPAQSCVLPSAVFSPRVSSAAAHTRPDSTTAYSLYSAHRHC